MCRTDSTWPIALSGWIIQDRNYPDFTKDQHAEFAVEFHLADVELAKATTPAARHIEEARYEVTARIAYMAADTWVIDCGLLAYRTLRAPPNGLNTGDWITATAWLGVDPYFYVEYLHRQPDIPALVYHWTIDRIRIFTAPGYSDIDATDAWGHDTDTGSASYLLDCRRLGQPAQRHSATSRY